MQAAFIVYAVFVALALVVVMVVFTIIAVTSLVRVLRRRFGKPGVDADKVHHP